MKTNDKGTDQGPEKPKDKELAVTQPAGLTQAQLTQSERFSNAVIKEFKATAGKVDLTPFQRKLIQNYFIKLDQTLKINEDKRLKVKEKYRDPLAFKWENVNMNKLAVDVVAWSSVGLDPTQPNHINIVPYKNKGTNKFDIGFIIGYKGSEIKGKKYGIDVPDDVIVELVFETDIFKQIKRDANNRVESYTFEITDDFNRGEVKGGFYYFVYLETPEKNRLKVFSKADIEKRKPEYASPEFWGGEKDEYKWDDTKEKNVKTGKKIKVEGWYEEMCYKTIYRAGWNSVTIDSEKIDAHLMRVIESDREATQARVISEIENGANKTEITIEPTGEEDQGNNEQAQEEGSHEQSVEGEGDQTNGVGSDGEQGAGGKEGNQTELSW